jgi:hypothetical protein
MTVLHFDLFLTILGKNSVDRLHFLSSCGDGKQQTSASSRFSVSRREENAHLDPSIVCVADAAAALRG